ncbi:MAG: ribosome biogenesis GTPase Der [Clostridia bacterium]
MKKPLVAVVGRPNVGKSTFFNKLCGKKISIVDDVAGITRDRIYADVEWTGHVFTLVDTGGLDSKNNDVFQANIQEQAKIAIKLADVIVFLTDGTTGVTPQDFEISVELRQTKKPIVLVVNKLDTFKVENTYEFYQLGMGDPFPISCEQSKGLGEVLDAIVNHFPEKNIIEETTESIKIAIVGRPNAGKSSITNALLGENRVAVSEIAGTTRDAVDTPFKFNGKNYILIDTAGLRRKRNVVFDTVESFSVLRAMSAIRRADIVLIVMDASDEVTEQDIRICGYVHEEGKPSVVVFNKWDAVEKDNLSTNKFTQQLADKLQFMPYFKTVFVSALTGRRMGDIMPSAILAYENARRRISTGSLNNLLSDAILAFPPSTKSGKQLKIKYITQAETNPPTFILFCNDAKLAHFSYVRYLENTFRKAVDFSGTPIKFNLKSKETE